MPRHGQFPSGKQTMNIVLSKEMSEALRQCARNEETTASEVIRRALTAYFLAHNLTQSNNAA